MSVVEPYCRKLRQIYSELQKDKFDLKIISRLESSGILEREIWPSFPPNLACLKESPTPSLNPGVGSIPLNLGDPMTLEQEELVDLKSTIMTIAILLSEKFRQTVNVWSCLDLEDDVESQTGLETAATKFRLFVYMSWFIFLSPEKFALSMKESSFLIQLFIYLFQSLEHDAVRRVTMSLCGIPTWLHLGTAQKEDLIKQRPELCHIWKAVGRRYRKVASTCGDAAKYDSPNIPLQTRFILLDRDALAGAICRFLTFVEREAAMKIEAKNLRVVTMEGWTAVDVFSGKAGVESINENAGPDVSLEFRNEATTDITPDEFLFCERFLEFMIDILSQLPTRRFFRPLFLSTQLLPRLRLSMVYRHCEAALVRQLATLLAGYEVFEVDDVSGEALQVRDLEGVLYDRVKELQVVCYKIFSDVDVLREVALGSVAALGTTSSLRSLFTQLTLSQLLRIAEELRLVEAKSFADSALFPLLTRLGQKETTTADLSAAFETLKDEQEYHVGHCLLVEVLTNHLHRRRNQIDDINRLPLFPTGALIWDPNIIPTEKYQGDFSLALPKLNLQFLTLRDYLVRNFHLFRLESAYEIREDLEDAVWRMKPALGYAAIGASGQDQLKTNFTGNCKMACAIDNFSIVYVKEPGVGSDVPSVVRGEITIDLKSVGKQAQQGWDALRQFDVLFLLAVKAPLQPFTDHPSRLMSVAEFPEKFGVVDVRGCEVVEILDEEGKCISEPSSNGQPAVVPFGSVRTLRVVLDANQYQHDLDEYVQTKETDVDIYAALNLIVRRNPAENNFKSILETIRNLMNDSTHTVTPAWLHDLFLGYGDPTSAQYFNLAKELKIIDFVDTFVDQDHIRQAFPNIKRLEYSGGAYFGGKDSENRINNLVRVQFEGKAISNAEKSLPNFAHPPEDKAIVQFYNTEVRGPYQQCAVKRNTIRFVVYALS